MELNQKNAWCHSGGYLFDISVLTRENLRIIRIIFMGCIDVKGNITRSGELILLALMGPSRIEAAARESGQPLFKVRSTVREFSDAGFVKLVAGGFQITPQGIKKLEGKNSE